MILLKDLRAGGFEFGCFLAAILIYAALGSPTPDAPGVVEAVIGGLLALALFRPALLSFRQADILQILMCCGLGVPVVIGAVQGNAAISILRDVAGFLFLMLPFFAMLLVDRETRAEKLRWVFVVLGLAFSARAILDVTMMVPESLTYFANTSGVLFACVFLIGGAIRAKGISYSVLLLLMALLPLVAMSLTLQRASLGFIALALACFLWQRCRRDVSGLIVLILSVLAGIVLWPHIAWLYDSLEQKTVLFGGNMRVQEIGAVWDEISGSAFQIIFGKGWGGDFESPAVAGLRVNYTHNLLSAMLLKAGLTGVVLIVAYLLMIVRKLAVVFQHDRILALALLGPFLIGSFLYASYKSFDYGILLLLIVTSVVQQGIASRGQEV